MRAAARSCRLSMPAVRTLCTGGLFLALLMLEQMDEARAAGPLRVHPDNPRYFTDGSEKAIYFTGQHTWSNLQDMRVKSPEPFDFDRYLNFLQEHNQNFIRLWRFEYTGSDTMSVEPQPWLRKGPGMALDDKPKFDLTKLNQAYFDRLRSRVIAARDRGIYVSIMLFEGVYSQTGPRWAGHLFNVANNINGIDGDPNGDGNGAEVQTLDDPLIVEIQKAYVRKVIDTVNDLDNVLYEISNESPRSSIPWQYEMINYIGSYEKTKPRQHLIGMTSVVGAPNAVLFTSPADWISPSAEGSWQAYANDPPAATGAKVIINDTDHLGRPMRVLGYVWRCFTRGIHVIDMDHDHSGAMSGGDFTVQGYDRAMGHAVAYAERMHLAAMTPRNDLASTSYCLAHPGREYLIYQPKADEAFTVELNAGKYYYEWFSPAQGKTAGTGKIEAPGGSRQFKPPFEGDAVLYLKAV